MHQCFTEIKSDSTSEYDEENNHNISQTNNEQVSNMEEILDVAGKTYRVTVEFSKEGDFDALWEVRDFLIRKELKRKIGYLQREASAIQSPSQKKKCDEEDCK